MPSPDDTATTLPTDAELIARVDAELNRFVSSGIPSGALKEAVRYALFGGGKRIRPILCMRACMSVGGTAEDATVAAAAIESIHCFSLVHDDLPAMDDDDLRRGRPTLHKHTNEAMAILAGDAMTVLPFKMIAMQSRGSVTNQLLLLSITQTLASCTLSMIHGQVLDTMGGLDHVEDEFKRLREIHYNKTGMLLIAAVEMGARCGNASREQITSVQAYARSLGLMFQAVDDLLDVTQSTEQVGKQTGKDAAAGKLTYPGLLGIDGTRAEIAKLLEQSLAALEPLGPAADPLRAMARTLAARTK